MRRFVAVLCITVTSLFVGAAPASATDPSTVQPVAPTVVAASNSLSDPWDLFG